MVHKSNTAFLEPKMLLLCIFLVSCCLPGSMGDAIEEFKENLEALVARTNKEIFLPVPEGRFQCSRVPCQLETIIERLKLSFKTKPERTRISLMEENMGHITSTLKKTHTQPENTRSCPKKDLSQQRVLKSPGEALKRYENYFQRVHEDC